MTFEPIYAEEVNQSWLDFKKQVEILKLFKVWLETLTPEEIEVITNNHHDPT